jgi:hypothetical protein
MLNGKIRRMGNEEITIIIIIWRCGKGMIEIIWAYNANERYMSPIR